MNLCHVMARTACLAFAFAASAANSRTAAECAQIQFTFTSSGSLHVGVLGEQRISSSPCFKMVDSNGRRVNVRPDPVSTNWKEPSAKLNLPVKESFVANIGTGKYVLYLPATWVNKTAKREIAFGTASMKGSLGVNPNHFSGHPLRVNIDSGL